MDRMQPRNTNPSVASRPVATPAPASQQQSSKSTKKRQPRRLWVTWGIGALILVGLAIVFSRFGLDYIAGVKPDKYQAVFLSNGQVYFGKLSGVGGSYMRLTDVYYLEGSASSSVQTSDTEAAAGATQASQQLSKLGKEIHKPYDEMVIKSDQVVFFENIQADGSVGKAITDYKNKKD